MKLDALFKLFDEARKLIAHQDFVVIGSLSILGLEGDFDIPDGMTLSIAVTCYTKSDPERILDVLGALGSPRSSSRAPMACSGSPRRNGSRSKLKRRRFRIF